MMAGQLKKSFKDFTPDELDLLEEQIIFYKQHLDIFIEDYFTPIRLTEHQHCISRAFGIGSDLKVVQSRGSGKTWLTAVMSFAWAVLNPGTIIAIASGTAAQATLVLQKLKQLADSNPNIAREISMKSARSLVQLAKDKGVCDLKNGSRIESFAIGSMRGLRAKIVIIDETPEVDSKDKAAIILPIKNFTRDICFNYGFDDYVSKTVEITSACEKTNSFYDDFMRVMGEQRKGNRECWAWALDYNAVAKNPITTGITDMAFFEAERARQPDSVFAMEYGSRFVGATTGCVLPFSLVETCRTLRGVETMQPKRSQSRYVLAVDLATSTAEGADNSVIVILKFTEGANGFFNKKLVYIRSFHGVKLDAMAEEVRKLIHLKFPNIEKVVFDARGLGDSFSRFFDKEWVDPISGQEYPPLSPDDEPVRGASLPLLRPYRAVLSLNQRIFTNVRVNLEKRTLELPMASRTIFANDVTSFDEAGNEVPGNKLSQEARAIFLEANALQYEMGNIVATKSKSGNVLYDVPKQNMHKDRYSALAYGLDYICEIENESIKRHRRKEIFVGIVDNSW